MKLNRTSRFFNLANAKPISNHRRKNSLTWMQMETLVERGLYDPRLRDGEPYYAEDLICMLPACIVTDTMYSLKIYKTAWDIPCVAYKSSVANKNGQFEYLFSSCADDHKVNSILANQEDYYGSLVDALYATLIWVDDNFTTELAEFKWELRYSKYIHFNEDMNDLFFIRFEFTNGKNEKFLATIGISEYTVWESFINRTSDDEIVDYIKETFVNSHMKDIKFVDMFTGDEHTLIGSHKID